MRWLVVGIVLHLVTVVHADSLTSDPAASSDPRHGFVVGIGVSTHHLDLADRKVHGADSSQQFLTLPAQPLGSIQAETMDVALGYRLDALYLGVEMQFGQGAIAHGMSNEPAAPFGIAAKGVEPILGAGVTLGAELLDLGSLSARLEVYGGGMNQWLSSDDGSQSNYACDQDGCQGPFISTWVIEPRLRVHGWLQSGISIDGWGGVGVGPSRGDWSFGVAATFHGLDGLETLAAATVLLSTAPFAAAI